MKLQLFVKIWPKYCKSSLIFFRFSSLKQWKFRLILASRNCERRKPQIEGGKPSAWSVHPEPDGIILSFPILSTESPETVGVVIVQENSLIDLRKKIDKFEGKTDQIYWFIDFLCKSIPRFPMSRPHCDRLIETSTPRHFPVFIVKFKQKCIKIGKVVNFSIQSAQNLYSNRINHDFQYALQNIACLFLA